VPGLVALALVAGLGPGRVEAQPRLRPASQCVGRHSHVARVANTGPRSVFLCVGPGRLYRLDIGDACRTLRAPNVRLATRLRGSGWDSRSLVLELEVTDGHALRVPCAGSRLTAVNP
jgi:hypothetical protein